MAPFSKPETVLKQAEGLVSVGQSYAALQSLTEMFSSKRFRSTPLTSLEPIMNRFIELCVELRKGRGRLLEWVVQDIKLHVPFDSRNRECGFDRASSLR